MEYLNVEKLQLIRERNFPTRWAAIKAGSSAVFFIPSRSADAQVLQDRERLQDDLRANFKPESHLGTGGMLFHPTRQRLLIYGSGLENEQSRKALEQLAEKANITVEYLQRKRKPGG